MEARLKPVYFVGTSRADLRRLPEGARETAGFQLFKVQQGQEPEDWKPMGIVGSGVQEVRINDKGNAYRIFILARFEEAVYGLHVFQKRSQKTVKSDLRVAKNRYADLLSWRKEQGDL